MTFSKSHKWQLDQGRPSIIQMVIPIDLRDFVLSQLHNSVTGGRLGIKKTLKKVRERYFWHQMSKDVKYWCANCDKGASRKSPNKLAKASLKVYNVGAPMERWAIDVLRPLPKSNGGNIYLLVVVDYFSKWIDAIPMKNQKATTIARKFVDRIVSIFGVPMQLHSDRCFSRNQ